MTGSLLVAIYGAGAILAAIFPTERIDTPAEVWSQATIGMIHIAVSIVSFVGIILGMFVLAWTFRKEARWRSLLPWAAILPGAGLALFIAQGQGPWVGIMQRALVTVISGWLMLVAFRVRAIAASEETEISS